MTREEHPSNPDQLKAQALGVCWHSPGGSALWPCTPLADWEIELLRCDGDPIECNHEAALGEAEEKLTGWLRKVALYSNDGWLAQEARAEYVTVTGQEPPL